MIVIAPSGAGINPATGGGGINDDGCRFELLLELLRFEIGGGGGGQGGGGAERPKNFLKKFERKIFTPRSYLMQRLEVVVEQEEQRHRLYRNHL